MVGAVVGGRISRLFSYVGLLSVAVSRVKIFEGGGDRRLGERCILGHGEELALLSYVANYLIVNRYTTEVTPKSTYPPSNPSPKPSPASFHKQQSYKRQHSASQQLDQEPPQVTINVKVLILDGIPRVTTDPRNLLLTHPLDPRQRRQRIRLDPRLHRQQVHGANLLLPLVFGPRPHGLLDAPRVDVDEPGCLEEGAHILELCWRAADRG